MNVGKYIGQWSLDIGICLSFIKWVDRSIFVEARLICHLMHSLGT